MAGEGGEGPAAGRAREKTADVVGYAEAKSLFGTDDFEDAMIEIGVLGAGVLVLALAIFLLRQTVRSEPHPEHEPD